MLSSVLRSPRAVLVNIEIMRAFVRLRRMLASNADLARKLAELEKRYDAQFKVVFDAIRELMAPPEKPPRRIGVRSDPWSPEPHARSDGPGGAVGGAEHRRRKHGQRHVEEVGMPPFDRRPYL
jgi:hypothetical protein